MPTCPVCSGRSFEGGFCKKCGLPAPEPVQRKKSAADIRGAPGGQRITASRTPQPKDEPKPEARVRQRAKPMPMVDAESLSEKGKIVEAGSSLGKIQLAKKGGASPANGQGSSAEPEVSSASAEPVPLPLDALMPLDEKPTQGMQQEQTEPQAASSSQQSCPSCGAGLPTPAGKFCDACGLKLPSVRARRG